MIGPRIELALGEIVPFAMEDVEGGRRGTAATKLAALELMGDRERPAEVTLFVQIPSDNPKAIAQNATLLVQLLQVVLPDWSTSQSWLNRELEGKSKEVKFTKDRHAIVLRKTAIGVFLAIEFSPP